MKDTAKEWIDRQCKLAVATKYDHSEYCNMYACRYYARTWSKYLTQEDVNYLIDHGVGISYKKPFFLKRWAKGIWRFFRGVR